MFVKGLSWNFVNNVVIYLSFKVLKISKQYVSGLCITQFFMKGLLWNLVDNILIHLSFNVTNIRKKYQLLCNLNIPEGFMIKQHPNTFILQFPKNQRGISERFMDNPVVFQGFIMQFYGKYLRGLWRTQFLVKGVSRNLVENMAIILSFNLPNIN